VRAEWSTVEVQPERLEARFQIIGQGAQTWRRFSTQPRYACARKPAKAVKCEHTSTGGNLPSHCLDGGYLFGWLIAQEQQCQVQVVIRHPAPTDLPQPLAARNNPGTDVIIRPQCEEQAASRSFHAVNITVETQRTKRLLRMERNHVVGFTIAPENPDDHFLRDPKCLRGQSMRTQSLQQALEGHGHGGAADFVALTRK